MSKPIKALMVFETGHGRPWSVTKKFVNKEAMNNFATSMYNKKGYYLDEVFIKEI
jgi:hypothetical protein|tara:strand:+ start:3212 stop:3376 length:165 start_codon:yes stop_codon:yes gene_type:complete